MIYLVHGIRSRDPRDTMGGLQSAIVSLGLSCKMIDYGYILLPTRNRRARRAIRDSIKPGATIVGYSNGGAAIHAEAGIVKARHVILISPALPVDACWPPCVESVTVFYSPGDRVVGWGGTWAWIANRMPWRWGSSRDHPWGRMGIDGPRTDDPRVSAIELPHNIAHSWFRHPSVENKIAFEIVDVHVPNP